MIVVTMLIMFITTLMIFVRILILLVTGCRLSFVSSSFSASTSTSISNNESKCIHVYLNDVF